MHKSSRKPHGLYCQNFQLYLCHLSTKNWTFSLQDLAAINALMRIEVERKSSGVGKRLLADDVIDLSSAPPPTKVQIITPSQKVNTKLELIIGNRFQSEWFISLLFVFLKRFFYSFLQSWNVENYVLFRKACVHTYIQKWVFSVVENSLINVQVVLVFGMYVFWCLNYLLSCFKSCTNMLIL